MARIRSIKPELWLSPQVMNLTHSARLLFIGLITQADDEGRGTADPRRLKASIFGGDDVDSTMVRRWIDECSSNGLAFIYQAEGHGDLYELTGWRNHQRIDRPKKSHYPAPQGSNSTIDRRLISDASTMNRRGSDGSDGSLGSDGSDGSGRARDPGGQSSIEAQTPDPGCMVPRGTPADIFDGVAFWRRLLKPIYPRPTTEAEDMMAGRGIEILVGDGLTTSDFLIASVQAYAKQQEAAGNSGSQFVMNPAKFFGPSRHWRGPFPILAVPDRGKKATGHNWTPDPEDEAAARARLRPAIGG